MPDPTEEQMKGHELWTAIALCFGYNELGKKAESLGERMYFQLMRKAAEKEVESLGGTISVEELPPVMTLPVPGMPELVFTRDHIEQMRKVVQEHDAAQETTDPA